MNKTENFEIYGRKLAYNEDVKKFFKIWWKYSFGKERIFPEVVKIMESEKSEQEKVADILAAVEDHFKNPKDVYADKKPTKSIHGIAYNSFEDEKLEEFHSTCLFGVPAYNNTYTLYDFVDEFLDRSVAYEVFNNLVRVFQKFEGKGSTGLKINQKDFDLKKEYNEVYRFKSIHYGFEEKMTPSLITDYFSRKKRNDSIQLFAVDVLFSDIQGNSRKAQEIRFFNYILDSVYSLVDIFYYELFIRHIVLSLEDGGYIDEENISDFDLNKSNNMLLNLESAKDKVAVIVHAIRLFPGNIEVYRKASEYGLYNQELAMIIRYFTHDNGFDSQLLKILKSFIKNFNIRESFQYNKNAMDFIADFYNIDRTQYYKSIYKDSYEKVLKQFDSLAEMIKSNKISDTQLKRLPIMEDWSESSLKPAIISCFIGNPDEFVVMQNELGFTDLTEKLRSIINEPYCGNINEIVDVYADKLYQLIIRKIEEKDLEKKDSQKSFWNKERSTEEMAKGCLIFFALILLGIFLLVSFFTGN